jgi:hypothetical protein
VAYAFLSVFYYGLHYWVGRFDPGKNSSVPFWQVNSRNYCGCLGGWAPGAGVPFGVALGLLAYRRMGLRRLNPAAETRLAGSDPGGSFASNGSPSRSLWHSIASSLLFWSFSGMHTLENITRATVEMAFSSIGQNN